MSTLSDNAQAAYQFFIAKGLSAAQAAGIVGNLESESGVNPESVQPNGPGRGIAQWSLGGRWQPSLATGNNAVDLQNQLNYVWQELQATPAYGLAALKQQTTPTGAAQVFSNDYERPQVPYSGGRVANAVNVFSTETGGSAPTGVATPGSSTAAASSSTGNKTLAQQFSSLSITNLSSLGPIAIQGGLIIFGGILVIIGIVILFRQENAPAVPAPIQKGAKAVAPIMVAGA